MSIIDKENRIERQREIDEAVRERDEFWKEYIKEMLEDIKKDVEGYKFLEGE